MAFSIYRNGKQLKLKEGTVLSSTTYSQLINNGILEGPFTIPMDVPIAGNEDFFDYVDELKLINSAKKLNAGLDNVKVYLEGIWWLYGKIMVLRINDTTFSINLVVGLPALDCMNKKLQEFDWPIIELPTNVDSPTMMEAKLEVFKTRMQESYNEGDDTKIFNFPMIQNLLFYGDNKDKNLDYLGFMNAFDYPNYVSNIYGNYNAIVPMIYQLEILKRGFNLDGYFFDMSNLPGDYRKVLEVGNNDLVKMYNSFGVKAYNNSAVSTIDSSGADFIIIYDNDSPADGFWDDSGLWDTVNSEYIIKRPGIYRVRLNLSWVALYYGPSSTGVLAISVQVQNGTIDSITSTRPNFLATNFENDVDYYITVLEDGTCNGAPAIGEKIRVNLYFIDPANPGTTALVTAGGTIEITNLTRPKTNYFADEIDLSKCVPQDILFKDYVAAYASTWNIRFEVDAIRKTITAIKNEPGITSDALNSDALWKTNGVKPTTTIRAAKYKDMAYSWSGSDNLINGDKFVEWLDADVLGEVLWFDNLAITYAPSSDYLNKKAIVANECAVYNCIYDTDTETFKWVFYSYTFKRNYTVGNGSDTLQLLISPLMMTHQTISDITFTLPEIAIAGDSIIFGMTEKNIGLRMLLFLGSCQFALGLATIDMPFSVITDAEYQPSGDVHTYIPDFSMEYYREYAGTDRGMFSLWKNTIKVLNLTRMVTKVFNLSVEQFFNWVYERRHSMVGAILMTEQLSVTTKFEQQGISVEGEFGIEEVEIG